MKSIQHQHLFLSLVTGLKCHRIPARQKALDVGSKHMTTSNEFGKYYKTISNTELLNILENSTDYQPSAVEAAKKEFSDRHLSDAEIKEAKEPLIAKQIQKEKQKEKIKEIEDKVKKTGYTIIETLNPIQSDIPSTEKTIRLIVIIFGGIFLYQLIKGFRNHLAYIKDIPRFPFESILYLLPLILLPAATFTFWRRTTIGWTLLMAFLTYSISDALLGLFYSLTWKSSSSIGFDNLFPKPSPMTYILQLMFLIATIVVLCKSNIRQVFSINERRIAPTIGITILLAAALMLSVLL